MKNIIISYYSSLDVIHSFGLYSIACKVDVVPGRINSAASLRSSLKGELRGFCFELCGFGHSLMLFVILINNSIEDPFYGICVV